ncbi:hypothetical protein ACQVP2_28230 [Methylobacterium aquaticum]|uniref:hypothetical protein n=1 Tax=Methylobacterium aquaticum TaxID=270351 RepID=UPI003D183A21
MTGRSTSVVPVRPAALPRPEPVTVAEIEEAIVVVALAVSRDGTDAYLPILDRLEAELAQAKRAGSPRERAERLLRALTVEVR